MRRSVRRSRVDGSRREELLEQLEGLFLAEGFTALTVDEIARRLRCSKATLYSLASTKEQLVLSVTKHFFRTAADEIEAMVKAEKDPRERIATYLGGIGAEMRRNSLAFYQDMVSYPPTAAIYRRNAIIAAGRVQEMIQEGVDARVFRPVDGRFAGELVALAIDGILSGVLLDTTGFNAGEAFSELGDLLINGLARHDRRRS
jgi:AcrR family transcriptional regulator